MELDLRTAMGPSQASHALGVSGQHVRDLCKTGRLTAVRTTLGWLIDPEDVERLRSGTRGALRKQGVRQ